jgi:hypothetical protein
MRYLRIDDIIGCEAVSSHQARLNKEAGSGPRRSRTSHPALLPVGKTTFYALINAGKIPRPTKVGRMSFWLASDIENALSRLGIGKD